MDTKNNSYERLYRVIQWAGMSTHAFAMHIGMKRSENLYRIIRDKENVSLRLVVQILETYPEISRNWLVYGEGEMLCDQPSDNPEIPFRENLHEKPISLSSFLVARGVDLSMFATDDAMQPIIFNGSILLMESQSVDKIVYGRIYYVESADWSLVRAIRKSDISDDEVILAPANKSDYDSMSIAKSSITNLYLVNRVINNLK